MARTTGGTVAETGPTPHVNLLALALAAGVVATAAAGGKAAKGLLVRGSAAAAEEEEDEAEAAAATVALVPNGFSQEAHFVAPDLFFERQNAHFTEPSAFAAAAAHIPPPALLTLILVLLLPLIALDVETSFVTAVTAVKSALQEAHLVAPTLLLPIHVGHLIPEATCPHMPVPTPAMTVDDDEAEVAAAAEAARGAIEEEEEDVAAAAEGSGCIFLLRDPGARKVKVTAEEEEEAAKAATVVLLLLPRPPNPFCRVEVDTAMPSDPTNSMAAGSAKLKPSLPELL